MAEQTQDDVPTTGGRHGPECLALNPDAPLECATARRDAVRPDATTLAASRIASDRVHLVDLSDHFCDEMLHEVTGELASSLELIHIHHRKELENYLLEPAVLDRVIAGKRRERSRRTGQPVPEVPPAAILLEAIVDRTKEDVRGQIVGRYTEYIRKTSPGTDHSTIATEGMKRFDRSWSTLDTRLRVCPGKAVFAQFSEEVRSACGVGLTPLQVVNAMLPTEIAPDLAQFLSKLDMFRRTAVPRHG